MSFDEIIEMELTDEECEFPKKVSRYNTHYTETKKGKKHLAKIYSISYGDSVRKSYNGKGFVHQGNTDEWHPVYKKIDTRTQRYNGKEICQRYQEDTLETEMEYYNEDLYWGDIVPDDYHGVGNPWGYTEKEKREIPPNLLHGNFPDAKLEYIQLVNKYFNS